METTTRKYTINDIGCYIGGHVGIYQGEEVQQIALSCGMDIVPIGPHCYDAKDHCDKPSFTDKVQDIADADHAEEYTWRTDEALNWLNANMVEDDVFFEFFDGEFFLSSIAQREEEDYF